MNPTDANPPPLVLEYLLDAPPEKVWRAMGIPELREQWLPNAVLADAEPVAFTPGKEISYRMRDDQPPFLESSVTLQILPAATGGSLLRVIHRLDDARLTAANDSGRHLMRAA
ncbi:SRPBCC domain-containing protein [Pseudomonas lundensis]|uniref:SRPBCC family protein n=1 Tax=Serratia proteamaculans TaxID=28151 RepID=UPI002982A350|nr:SRPBCC domain-containing protein [Serratia proteamaculans]MDW5499582.1 SRPBCC domain-containing protein [Serratia proteamaculans]MDW5504643.1 SRPBCC domain-containing protein [Pseudomonas lundensis]